jgi:hypothetical protein
MPDREGGTHVSPQYRIMLSDKMSRKDVKAYVSTFSNGAIIEYDPKDSEEKIYNTIMHALGYLLLKYGVLPGDPFDENQVSLFVHLALG